MTAVPLTPENIYGTVRALALALVQKGVLTHEEYQEIVTVGAIKPSTDGGSASPPGSSL